MLYEFVSFMQKMYKLWLFWGDSIFARKSFTRGL